MIYSTSNMLLSANRVVADKLLSLGYNVYWHAADETETQVVLGAPLDTITIVPWTPANPVRLVILTGGNTISEGEAALPTLSVWVSNPRRVQRLGLGDPRWVRHRQFVVNGFAKTEAQQRALADLFDEWITVEAPSKAVMNVWDFDSDGSNPPALDPAEFEQCVVSSRENPTTDAAIRYYLQASAVISYVE